MVGGCSAGRGIEKELTRTDGVEGIDIDIGAGIVTVTMADGAAMTEEKAQQIVQDAGFTLAGFEKIETAAEGTKD